MASPCTKLLVGGSGEHKQQPEMRGTDVGLYDFFFIKKNRDGEGRKAS